MFSASSSTRREERTTKATPSTNAMIIYEPRAVGFTPNGTYLVRAIVINSALSFLAPRVYL
jgi:hypothetical protein